MEDRTMEHPRSRLVAALCAAALLLTMAALPAAGGDDDDDLEVIASGLDNPRGIAVGRQGRVYVAEASGGRITVIHDGEVSTFADGLPVAEIFEGEFSGPVNVDVHSGRLVVAIGGGDQSVDPRFDTVLEFRSGKPGHPGRVTGDVQAYRNAHPQPPCDPTPDDLEDLEIWCDNDRPPLATESNAYGIAVLPERRTLVTDAAGNELLLVKPGNRVVGVAKFPNHVVSAEHVGLPPGSMHAAEPVPTSVAVGPDGYWYVGELTGFPFTAGASRIWRIAPWARGVTCSEEHPTKACEVWKTGFTSIIDLDFGEDHALYVAEIIHSSVLNLFNGTDTVGAVWRVKGESRRQIAEGQLNIVGGIAVGRDDTLYVTTWSVTNEGQVVRIDD
jgi:hypothetical protein